MNNAITNIALVFRTRLKECMEKNNYNKSSLASTINSAFGTHYTRNDISRWLRVGEQFTEPSLKHKDGIAGFPKFEAIVYLSKVLKVDIGYLIGETDSKSFEMGDACNYTGLNETSIYNIRYLTNPMSLGPMRTDMRNTLNLFLSSNGFRKLFDDIYGLYLSSSVSGIEVKEFSNGSEVIDYKYNFEAEKRQLIKTFSQLIDEVFPPFSGENTIIKEDS